MTEKDKSLKKWFTDAELQLLEEYAKANNLTKKEAIYRLAKEYLETMSMRYLNGQQVLALMEMLMTKLPIWYTSNLMFLAQSSQSLKVLSKQLTALERPSALDRLMDLLEKEDLKSIVEELLTVLPTFLSKGGKDNSDEENKDEKDDTL